MRQISIKRWGFNYLTKATESRKKKEETKDEEYLITYTRHLEKRIRNLKAVNLRLKQELSNL